MQSGSLSTQNNTCGHSIPEMFIAKNCLDEVIKSSIEWFGKNLAAR